MKMNELATQRNLVIALFSLFVVLSLVNTALLSNITGMAVVKIAEAEEQAKPANIEVTAVTYSSCNDCYDITLALNDLKKQNVNIVQESIFDYDSSDGKQLVAFYGIKNLPALIIKGETSKNEQLQRYFSGVGELIDNNSTLYTKILPPYYDVMGDRITGRVSLTKLVNSSCDKCVSLSEIISFFKQAGVSIVEEKTVEYSSDEGLQLTSKFGVSAVPSLIISKDILDYESIKPVWSQLNTTEEDGSFALHFTAPPYVNVSTGETVGLVTLIMLNDTACSTCYDVSMNKNILARMGITPAEEFSYDVSSDEGKELISKYNITKVPIIILSPDAKLYDIFVQAWPQVGDVAEDGWYVMRTPEILGPIKDLSTGQLVQPQHGG